jgi:hypothetical protein
MKNVAPMEVSVESGNGGELDRFDDDGRLRRTGTVWTASSHIITAVIGSGVLSLAWSIAQLGWVAGPVVMLLFAFVTYYTATLLAQCYRTGHPETGKRNYTYMDAVRSSTPTSSASPPGTPSPPPSACAPSGGPAASTATATPPPPTRAGAPTTPT